MRNIIKWTIAILMWIGGAFCSWLAGAVIAGGIIIAKDTMINTVIGILLFITGLVLFYYAYSFIFREIAKRIFK